VGIQSDKEHYPALLSVMATQEVSHHSLALLLIVCVWAWVSAYHWPSNSTHPKIGEIPHVSCTRKHPLSSCVPIQSCAVQGLLYVSKVPVTYVTIKLEGAHGRDPAGSNWFFTTSCTQFTDQSYQKKLPEICPPVRTKDSL
jgi:hypothetical protein